MSSEWSMKTSSNFEVIRLLQLQRKPLVFEHSRRGRAALPCSLHLEGRRISKYYQHISTVLEVAGQQRGGRNLFKQLDYLRDFSRRRKGLRGRLVRLEKFQRSQVRSLNPRQ